MLKKYFICFLITAVFNLTGCYYSEMITKNDLDAGKYQIDFKEELYCTTKDYTRYHFLPGNYHMANDSLFGKGAIESSSQILPFQGYIAVPDIISFEQKRVDTGATIGLITGIIAVGVVIFSLVFAYALEDSFNPD